MLSVIGAVAVIGVVTTEFLTARPADLARAVLAGHTRTVTDVVFSPDGHTLATGSEDGTARLWDITNHR